MTPRVSLAELAAADIQLRPAEAVVIVAEICRRCIARELPGIPSPGVIRLTRAGSVLVEGPMTTGDDVARAAQLLNELLAGFDATPEYRASGALRLVIARALGTLDLPRYASVAEFRDAIARFATADLADTARGLFHAWERGRATRELQERERIALTISDIRRARRATGMTLEQIAAIAEVPPTQLRDLEWGYLRNWRADDQAREHVIRYARAAGLDERLVLSIAWPMIQESAGSPQPAPEETALVPSGPQFIVLPMPRRASEPRRHYVRWAAAAVAVLLLLVASLFAIPAVAPAAAPLTASRVEAAPIDTEVPAAAPAPAPGDTPAAAAAQPRTKKPAAHRAQPAFQRKKDQPPPRKPNIFQRELIRIVFR